MSLECAVFVAIKNEQIAPGDPSQGCLRIAAARSSIYDMFVPRMHRRDKRGCPGGIRAFLVPFASCNWFLFGEPHLNYPTYPISLKKSLLRRVSSNQISYSALNLRRSLSKCTQPFQLCPCTRTGLRHPKPLPLGWAGQGSGLGLPKCLGQRPKTIWKIREGNLIRGDTGAYDHNIQGGYES